jgi:hypothetical protein
VCVPHDWYLEVLGLEHLRPARRRHKPKSQHADHDQCRRHRRAPDTRRKSHVRVPHRRYIEVLGPKQRLAARRWRARRGGAETDQSQHADHDQCRRHRRAAGARKLPHVRVPHGRYVQVLGPEHRRPARRQHDSNSDVADHDRCQRRRRAAGARTRLLVRVPHERYVAVLGQSRAVVPACL